MRLWHIDIITKLPRAQLLGQHRECSALRGNGWLRRHSTVNYVFLYSPRMLHRYHMLIIAEMESRGYSVDSQWKDEEYRGKQCQPWNIEDLYVPECYHRYPQHNQRYLMECIENLRCKGVTVDVR